MSAHPTPHSSEESGSFWSLANIIIAILLGGFAFFWSVTLLGGAIGRSSGWIKDAAPAAAAAPAADAAAPATPATPPPATAAPATAVATTAAPAPTAAGVAEITIKVDTSNPMAYDTKEFKVKAGQKVKLTFNNVHPVAPMPHNLVLGKVGSKDKLMAAAMQIMTDPNGMAKGYIPQSPDILYHTKLLQPNTSETLEFTAPAAGAYPYICTFPGHAIMMNGVMTVE